VFFLLFVLFKNLRREDSNQKGRQTSGGFPKDSVIFDVCFCLLQEVLKALEDSKNIKHPSYQEEHYFCDLSSHYLLIAVEGVSTCVFLCFCVFDFLHNNSSSLLLLQK
jgi:hypothetical protein